MKIKSRKKSKKFISTVVVASILLVVGVVALLFYLNHNPMQDSSNSDNTTKISHDSDKKQAQDLKENPDNKQNATNSDKPAAPTGDTSTGKQRVQMTSSNNISDGTVYLRGGINYPVKDGSCYALLSGPSGQSIRKDTTLLQNPASTDCKTVLIPISELASGKWTFALHYTSDNYEGTSSEDSFNI